MTRLIKNSPIASFSFLLLLAVSLAAAVYPGAMPQAAGEFNSGDIAWMLSAAGLVLLMTPGLSFFYGGMVSPKNIISTMLQSFMALAVVTIVWLVVGFSLSFGDSIGGLVGNPLTHLFFKGVGTAAHDRIATNLPFVLFAAFQLKFAIITPALITGSFAERVRFWGYLVFVGLWTVFIYAPLAHWTWHPDGFLFKMGVLDFAGGTVVHISAGCAALAGAMVLGRRKSHVEGKSFSPANIPYVMLGTGLLWFGWFGFNAGSALGANNLAVKAFVNTNLASAAAAIAWILVDTMRGHKPSALGACIGAVVGLVAITPACGFVDFGPSIFIGFTAALISNYAVGRKSRSDLDDTLDVFPCHGVGGMVGMIMTAIFAREYGGVIAGEWMLLAKHLLALGIVVVYTFAGSWLMYKLTNWITPLRVEAEQEEIGLDRSQHDEWWP
ncbi:MAG: ammonium transporter [Haliscomenobacter sp.]|nr:ammonium transporter [Haliscomenobacter sp.]MBP9874970.1 ammonium transporter [Haliscomenobacter sp.]